jgi:hypothetical protein
MPAPVAQHRSMPVCPEARAFSQIQRRLQAAQVNLFTHEEFPQLTFGARIDRLNV